MSDPKQAHAPDTDPLPGETRRAIAELRVGIPRGGVLRARHRGFWSTA
jgi:hypothetical protein